MPKTNLPRKFAPRCFALSIKDFLYLDILRSSGKSFLSVAAESDDSGGQLIGGFRGIVEGCQGNCGLMMVVDSRIDVRSEGKCDCAILSTDGSTWFKSGGSDGMRCLVGSGHEGKDGPAKNVLSFPCPSKIPDSSFLQRYQTLCG